MFSIHAMLFKLVENSSNFFLFAKRVSNSVGPQQKLVVARLVPNVFFPNSEKSVRKVKIFSFDWFYPQNRCLEGNLDKKV